MDLLELLILIVIAGICGAVAEYLIGFKPGGLIVSIIVGVIGAYLGNWLAETLGLPRPLNLPVGTTNLDLFWSIVGTIIFLLILGTLRSGRLPLPGRGRAAR